MTRLGIAAALVLPLAAACNRAPEPAPMVAAPVAAGPEAACIDRAVAATGADPAGVTAAPVSSSKTGATVYAVTSGGVDYTCVVEIDGTVSAFGAA